MGTVYPSKKIALILSALAFVTFGAALLLYPAQILDNVTASVLYCLTSLVPSLFPFMVLASFGVRSGAGEVLGRLLSQVTRYVFRLPRICGATLAPQLFRRLSCRGARRFPAAGRGRNHPGTGRTDDDVLRGSRSCLCGHLSGMRRPGKPANRLAAVFIGHAGRAAFGMCHRAGETPAR